MLDYPQMIQDAARTVVRRALAEVAEMGLPGEHHFFVAFRTDHPGVRMPARLREQYPQIMKIVLQYQFWDLVVDEQAFSVALRFGGVREHLTVPFAAVTTFADPAVNFALQFQPVQAPEPEPPADSQELPVAEGSEPGKAQVVQLDTFRKT